MIKIEEHSVIRTIRQGISNIGIENVYEELNVLNKHLDNRNHKLEEILNIVSKIDKSLNPERSVYQSKKDMVAARAKADIKRDTIINKRK